MPAFKASTPMPFTTGPSTIIFSVSSSTAAIANGTNASLSTCAKGSGGWYDALVNDHSVPVRDNGVSSKASPSQSGLRRSDEHTSELQSLMRISSAVFCSKKKKQKEPNN